jgi:membrane associated rhomboid family serine protease
MIFPWYCQDGLKKLYHDHSVAIKGLTLDLTLHEVTGQISKFRSTILKNRRRVCMLPISDDNSTRRIFPLVTYVLLAANVLFFFVELTAGDAFLFKWAFVPSRFLANPGADFLTLFTSMFMHGGWLHLGGNMLYLWIFGDNVEDRFGHVKFLIFYLLCGLAATFAQMAFSMDSNIPNLGASGAIAGVLGAYILLFPHARVNVLMGRGIIPMSALIVIGFWIILQFFNSVGSIFSTSDTGGVAYMAHVGGFIAGLILAFILRGNSASRSLPG